MSKRAPCESGLFVLTVPHCFSGSATFQPQMPHEKTGAMGK